MSYTLTPEQLALLDLARTSWRRRGSFKRHGVSFGEESITETILSDIVDSYPGTIKVVSFNKRQEGRNGADWAWAFVSEDGTKVMPMLLQAKVLDLQDAEYPEIGRTIGKTKPLIRQIDRLISTASKYGWPALYAFYNHLDDVARIPRTCQSLKMAGTPIIPGSWGISVAFAQFVRSALNDQSFDTHRHHSIALHCLLCSKGTGLRPSSGSPGLLLNALEQLRALSMSASRSKSEIDLASRSLPDIELPNAPLDALPDMFQLAQRVLSSESVDQRESFRRSFSDRYPEIAGVVMLWDGDQIERT